MTWIGCFRPILSCPGIIPLALTLCWSGQTRWAATISPILGFITGLTIWLGTAQSLYGTINLTTTEESLPALFGAIGSFFSPALYSGVIPQYKPYKFDWRQFLRIELAEEIKPKATISNDKEEGNSTENDTTIWQENTYGVAQTAATDSSEQIPDMERHAVPTGGEKTELSTETTGAVSRIDAKLDDIHHPFDETRWENCVDGTGLLGQFVSVSSS
ncbi:Fc.00g043180.m01.CDS01 [Cosmosporella sp. VM-42]